LSNLGTKMRMRKLLKSDQIKTFRLNTGGTFFLTTGGGSKYSQNYIFEKQSHFTEIAEAGVALLIFATTFLWLFL